MSSSERGAAVLDQRVAAGGRSAIAVIAIESTAYFGSDRTCGPLRDILEALFGPVSDRALGSLSIYYSQVRPLPRLSDCWA